MNKYFEFDGSVKVCCGTTAMDNLAYELDFLGSKSPMLLSDEGLVKAKTVDLVIKSAKKVKFKTVFTNIPADSSTVTINQIARLYKNNKCDGIVAVGGGSVIDTAKGVRLLLSQDTDNIMELCGNEVVKKGKHVPFIVLPTTCGTGSECTSVAVIKDAKTKTKLEFITSELLPNTAIIDARLTAGLPPKLMASTAIDALTHAIEAYSSLQKNPISDIYATTAVKLIVRNLEDAINGDAESKLNLAIASNIAGTAFSNAMVGAVHALGHACGAVCGIPHGNAMAILLPACLRFNIDANRVEYSNLLLYATNEDTYANTKSNDRAQAFIDAIEGLIRKVSEKTGLLLKLKDYGVKEKQLVEVCEKAINDGAAIVNNKPISRDDAMAILQEVY